MNVNITSLDKNLEHWASIDGYLNYQVSWWGRVENTKTGRILKPGAARGYLFVALCRNGVRQIHYIHKLVAREWVPNPEEKKCVQHEQSLRKPSICHIRREQPKRIENKQTYELNLQRRLLSYENRQMDCKHST